jgi:tetratricopeptide (TPR) repeat protein
VHRDFGKALENSGNADKAIREYEAAAAIEPGDELVHTALGTLYLRKQNFQAAAEHYRAALTRPDGLHAFEARLGLGIALFTGKQYDDALEHLQAAAGAKPGEFLPHYYVGLSLAYAGQYGEAISAYDAALEARPNDPECLNNLGWVHFQQGGIARAAELFGQATAASEGFYLAALNLAIAYENLDQDDKAFDQWRLLVGKFGTRATPHIGLANTYYDRGMQDEALAEYLRGLELDDTNVDAHNNVALIYLSRGDLDEAVTHLKMALHVNDEYKYAHNNLGVAYEKLDRKSEAIEQYRRALAIDPDYEHARQNLRRLTEPAAETTTTEHSIHSLSYVRL